MHKKDFFLDELNLQGKLFDPGIFPKVLTSSRVLTSIRLIEFSFNPFLTSSNETPELELQTGIDKTRKILHTKSNILKFFYLSWQNGENEWPFLLVRFEHGLPARENVKTTKKTFILYFRSILYTHTHTVRNLVNKGLKRTNYTICNYKH